MPRRKLCCRVFVANHRRDPGNPASRGSTEPVRQPLLGGWHRRAAPWRLPGQDGRPARPGGRLGSQQDGIGPEHRPQLTDQAVGRIDTEALREPEDLALVEVEVHRRLTWVGLQ